jgi:hypothetical protein
MNADSITYTTVQNWAYTTLGMGYGLAQRAVREGRRVTSLLAQIGLPADTAVVVSYEGHEESYDEEWGDYRDRDISTSKTKTLHSVLAGLVAEAYNASDRYGDGSEPMECGDGYEWEQVTDLEGVSNAISSTQDGGYTAVVTVEGWEKAKQEKRRNGLEATASNFARECGKAVGTREFVQAVKERLAEVSYQHDRWNDGECQMERWATCTHSGSRNSYFADNDYMNGRYGEERGRLADVLDYMRDNFPLLMLHIDEDEKVEANG